MASERVKFLVHEGRQVLLLELTRASVQQIAGAINEARPMIQRAEPKSILTLTDVTDITVRDVSASKLIAFMKDNRPYVKAAAVTGVSGVATAMLGTMRVLSGRTLTVFKTRQEALDWLVSVQ